MNDSDRLLAEGIPLVLADGRSVALRYTMRSLKVIEDAYGSLDAVDQAMGSKRIGSLATILAAGLLHEDISADALLDLLDTHHIDDYATAMGTALDQALPAPETAAAGKADRANASNGSTSTTSPPSAMAGMSAGSGQ